MLLNIGIVSKKCLRKGAIVNITRSYDLIVIFVPVVWTTGACTVVKKRDLPYLILNKSSFIPALSTIFMATIALKAKRFAYTNSYWFFGAMIAVSDAGTERIRFGQKNRAFINLLHMKNSFQKSTVSIQFFYPIISGS